MNTWTISAAAVLLPAFLAACQTTQPAVPTADPSTHVPANYAELVAAHFRSSLKDPYSVRDASISGPTTVFVGLINGGTAPGVCVRMNAKNSFGAYIGLKTLAVAFQHGFITGVGEPVFDTCQNVVFGPFPELAS